MTTINPRSITDHEAPFLPQTFDDLAELGQLLTEAGHSPAMVQGILGWLTLKAAGQRDRTSQHTRSKYRKALAELAAEQGPSPRRRSQAGVANLLAVAGVTATAAVGAVTKNPRAAAMAVPALVYITYTGGDDDQPALVSGGAGASIHTLCAAPSADVRTVSTPMAA